MLAYRVLRQILRFVVSVFFRQVEVTGAENIPRDGEGPVIFAGNHPNSLLDPVLLLVTCGRICHFAAKDVLFKTRVMRALLGGLGAVPIARRSDHATDGPLDNQGAFDRLGQVLVEGRAMGIFPEGISHDSSQLARLKTGAARIALGVVKEHDIPLIIIPCGLTYMRRKSFRSRVLVQYGAPIKVEGDDPKALTQSIDDGLRALTVNAPDWETLTVLDAVRRLYQPPGVSLAERTELARRFTEVYASVKDHPEVVAIYTRVEAYLERLRAAGLSDRDLRRKLSAGQTFVRVVRQLALALVWLPLAVPGLVLHAPLGLLIGWAGVRLTPRKDVIATTKFVLGLVMLPLVFAGILGALWWWKGPLVAGLGLLLLVLSGLATLRVLERGARVGQILLASVRALALGKELDNLRKERADLELEVVRAVGKFRPADMVPLFPRAD